MLVQEWLGKDNKLGQDIWEKKYQHNGETLDEWFDRISGGNEKIKQLIKEKKFLFGGRILANRGLNKDNRKISYSNCYVIEPPSDNIESIFECAKKLARTYSYGGGCGIDISKLAPRGAKVNNAAKETTGSVSFMDLYSLVTGLIGQSGRRGALMLSISCNHPDLEEFIEIKSDLDKVTKANISVRITSDFMKAVKNKEMYTLSFTREETGEVITKEVDAYKVFARLCEMNWDYAEPGMLYWDRIEDWNLVSEDEEFEYAGTNPCAEEPLPKGGACLLGSINLSEFVKDDKTFDFNGFEYAVEQAIIALNEVLDEGLPLHPLQEQKDSARDWRQVGLGIFGLSDMLIKMNIRYGSEKSLELCDYIASIMADVSISCSADLAEKEECYPKFKLDAIKSSKYFIENTTEATKEKVSKYGLRNSQLLTIAPTGSLSSMLGVSGGIEPIYANFYERKTESLHGHDEYYKVYTPIVKEYMEKHNIKDDSELPDFFVTAQTLDYRERIRMQAVWQEHIDASISSTINVPYEFTKEQVEDLYMYAYEKGLKGVTIFRDGCKRISILNTNTTKKDDDENDKDLLCDCNSCESCDCKSCELPRGHVIDVSEDLVGYKRKLMTGCGPLHFEMYCDEETGLPQETFLNVGSGGGCERNYQFISRLMSLALRAGVSLTDIIDQANSIRPCVAYTNRTKSFGDTSKGTSCPAAIGHALKELQEKLKDMYPSDCDDDCSKCAKSVPKVEVKKVIPKKVEVNKPKLNVMKCPECGEPLAAEGGCFSCKACSYTRCD